MARPPENPRNTLRIFIFSESTSAVAELRTVLAFGRLAPTEGDSRGVGSGGVSLWSPVRSIAG